MAAATMYVDRPQLYEHKIRRTLHPAVVGWSGSKYWVPCPSIATESAAIHSILNLNIFRYPMRVVTCDRDRFPDRHGSTWPRGLFGIFFGGKETKLQAVVAYDQTNTVPCFHSPPQKIVDAHNTACHAHCPPLIHRPPLVGVGAASCSPPMNVHERGLKDIPLPGRFLSGFFMVPQSCKLFSVSENMKLHDRSMKLLHCCSVNRFLLRNTAVEFLH